MHGITRYRNEFMIAFYVMLFLFSFAYLLLVHAYIQQAKTSDMTNYQIKLLKHSLLFFVYASLVMTCILVIARNSLLKTIAVIGTVFAELLIRYTVPFNILLLLVGWMIFCTSFFYSSGINLLLSCTIYLTAYLFVTLFPLSSSFITPHAGQIPTYINLSVMSFSLLWGIVVFLINKIFKEYDGLTKALDYEQKLNIQLSNFNTTLQQYIKQYGTKSAEEERLRITREMHDANGYHFTNIIALMNAAISSGNKEWTIIEDILQTTLEQARKGLAESRRVLHELRDALSGNTYANAHREIYQIIKIFQNCTGIDVDVFWGNLSLEYTSNTILVITRIIQESLVNAVKHGQANRIQLYFWESNSVLTFIIEDNGKGSTKIVKGIGLQGMEERLAPYGGSLQTENNLPHGFKVTVHLPLISQKERVEND